MSGGRGHITRRAADIRFVPGADIRGSFHLLDVRHPPALLEEKVMYRAVASLSCGSLGACRRDRRAKPTDPQIAHIAHTAGQLDIEAAKQALEKSKNQEVRTFAQRMVGDHTSVNDQALALVQKLNVTPEDNPTSQSLTQAADAERKKLAGLDGAALDKAYVDNEVAYQKTVNEAFPKLKGFPVEFGGSGEQIAE
jgi:putative membrane protein